MRSIASKACRMSFSDSASRRTKIHRLRRFLLVIIFGIVLIAVHRFQLIELLLKPRLPVSVAAPFPCLNAVPRLNKSLKTSQAGIPLILHQIYKDANVPEQYIPLIRGCRERNKDFLHVLWTDDHFDMFLRDTKPELMPLYRNYYLPEQRSDFMRLVILEHFGGVYIDLDVECRKPLLPTLDALNKTCILDRERDLQSRLLWNLELSVMNSAMMSTPGHKFIRFLLESLEGSLHYEHVLNRTGPHFMTRSVLIWNKDPNRQQEDYPYVAPSEYFSPLIDFGSIESYRSMCSRCSTVMHPIKGAACLELRKQNNTQDDKETIRKADSTLVHRFMHLVYSENHVHVLRKLNVCREIEQITLFHSDCTEDMCLPDE